MRGHTSQGDVGDRLAIGMLETNRHAVTRRGLRVDDLNVAPTKVLALQEAAYM